MFNSYKFVQTFSWLYLQSRFIPPSLQWCLVNIIRWECPFKRNLCRILQMPVIDAPQEETRLTVSTALSLCLPVSTAQVLKTRPLLLHSYQSPYIACWVFYFLVYSRWDTDVPVCIICLYTSGFCLYWFATIRLTYCLSEWWYYFAFPPTIYESLIVGRLPELYTVRSFSFTLAILVGTWWYLVVGLICISLLKNDLEYLFMCLLVICISFLVKWVDWLLKEDSDQLVLEKMR